VAATTTLHQVEGNLVVDNTLKPTTLRRSERSKSTADVHILQKTKKLAVKKNLESPGNLQRDVLATFLGPVVA
jgi:hypothetical protein